MLRTLITKQWPFWLGGLFVGIAEIVYYIHSGNDDFIVVTTGFAQMYAASEQFLGIDWVGRVYEPGIHWTIIGAILGAFLVGIGERESRVWVHYSRRMLMLAFIGGMLFSFGTRLAAGCTTHHFIGGIPSMSIASWAVLLSGIPFAFLAFKIALWADLGGYFRHQESRDVARRYADDPHNRNPGYQPGYRPWRDPLRLLLLALLLLFLGVPLALAVFGDSVQGSIARIGWTEALWLLAPGLLLGIGIAKCGFGTECSVMAPESAFMSRERYCDEGVPLCTYRMFRSMLPLQGFMVAIVLFNLYILGAWLLGAGSIPNAAGDQGLYWGHIVGGPLLAMGAVFMIGCEVRTYARLGLGYATALAALPGFFIGYIPYTLFKGPIDSVLLSHGLTDYLTIPEWASYTLGGSEAAWSIGYSLALVFGLVLSFEAGRRFLAVRLRDLLTRNTDDLVYGPEPRPGAAATPAPEPAGG